MALARTFSRLCLAGLLLLAEWPAAAAEAGRPADEVARLIKQLGHAEFAQREAAERRLIEIGEPAIPALEKAARGDDPEVVTRAKRALAALVSLDAKTVRELKAQGQRAFAAGDYAAMRAAYRRLSIAAAATLDDKLWRGRACQLAGLWADAIAAYRKALAAVDTSIRKAAGAPADAKHDDPAALAAIRRALDPPKDSKLVALVGQRAELLGLMGKLQRGVLDDPAAAVATLRRVLDYPARLAMPAAKLLEHREQVLALHLGGGARRRISYGDKKVLRESLRTARELAEAQEQIGRPAEALETLSRVALLRVTYGLEELPEDLAWLAHLVQKLPPDAEAPTIGVLHILTRKQPAVIFPLAGAKTLARTHGFALVGPTNAPWTYFAVAPPPGLEFRAVTVRLEGPGTPFSLYCSTLAASKNGPVGFLANAAKRYALPPGAGVLRVSFMPKAELANKQRLILSAELRPRTPRERWPADAPWHAAGEQRQVERQRPKEPFQWRLTNLHHFGTYGQSYLSAQATLARLPDGRWLLAYGQGPRSQRRIRLATSTDLVTWTAAPSFPMAKVFECDGPTLAADADGTVWLAYFSAPFGRRRGSPVLWLASTRDGRQWTRPRPILGPVLTGEQVRAVQVLRAPDGRFWMFHEHLAAAAPSLGALRSLRAMGAPWKTRSLGVEPCYAIDAKGRFHVVFHRMRRSLFYSHSADARTWDAAVELVPHGELGEMRRPQLLLRGGHLALIYSAKHAEYLQIGTLAAAGAKLGEPKLITHFLASMNGNRVHVTPAGEILTFVGEESVWLLRAKLAVLLGLGGEL